MEFKELAREEILEWERYYDDDFESYPDDTLDDEARDLLCDIARATVIYGDAGYLLGIRVHQGAAMQRW